MKIQDLKEAYTGFGSQYADQTIREALSQACG